MSKAQKLQNKALGLFEQAHSDLLEAARLQNEDSIQKNEAATRLAVESARSRNASHANTQRAKALGDLLGL